MPRATPRATCCRHNEFAIATLRRCFVMPCCHALPFPARCLLRRLHHATVTPTTTRHCNNCARRAIGGSSVIPPPSLNSITRRRKQAVAGRRRLAGCRQKVNGARHRHARQHRQHGIIRRRMVTAWPLPRHDTPGTNEINTVTTPATSIAHTTVQYVTEQILRNMLTPQTEIISRYARRAAPGRFFRL